MSACWERIAAPQAWSPQEGPLLMDAVLSPNRSMSRHAAWLVLGAFTFANAVLAVFFLAHGAYPVSGFLGLDVLALAWAFHASARSGRARERVRVTPARIEVARQAPDRAETAWAASPLWARVQNDPRAVRIASGGGAMLVGGFLSPPERAHFAEALQAALAAARAQRPSTSRME
ncbi:MAG: DUF2244 domain-containing protein [Hyphomonadaceae bacterium]